LTVLRCSRTQRSRTRELVGSLPPAVSAPATTVRRHPSRRRLSRAPPVDPPPQAAAIDPQPPPPANDARSTTTRAELTDGRGLTGGTGLTGGRGLTAGLGARVPAAATGAHDGPRRATRLFSSLVTTLPPNDREESPVQNSPGVIRAEGNKPRERPRTPGSPHSVCAITHYAHDSPPPSLLAPRPGDASDVG